MTNMEVDQQPDTFLAHTHIRDDLRFMYRRNFLNALEFNYNKIIHQQIDSISKVDANGLINYGNSTSTFTSNPSFLSS